jgi:hypothetical protein
LREAKEFAEQQRIEVERPLREQEAAYAKTLTELAKLKRDALLNRPDAAFKLYESDEEMIEFYRDRGSAAGASAENRDNVERFCRDFPDYVRCQENFQNLARYIQTNCDARGAVLNVVTYGILKRAYERLLEYGLLRTPEHVWITPEPKKPDYFDRLEEQAREEALRLADESERTGVNERGETVMFTPKQIRDMSADQYKRAFFKKLNLDVGSLFTTMAGLEGLRK